MIVTIQGQEFQLSEPFGPGSRLDAAEAKAVNALRAENIRNNLNKAWGKRGLVPDEADVRLYDQTYRLGQITPALRGLEDEVARLTEERLETGEPVDLPTLLVEARERLEARRAIISAGIEAL